MSCISDVLNSNIDWKTIYKKYMYVRSKPTDYI